MSKGKFKKRKIIIPVLILAIVGGAVFGIVSKHRSSNVAKAVNVGEINVSWLDEGASQYYGTLKKGSVVNYGAEEELEIDEILVKKGDTVSKGDVLFTYNTKSLEFNAETCENELKTLENKITIANNELTVLKRLQPSENAPVDYEPGDEPGEETSDIPSGQSAALELEQRLTKNSEPFAGSGTEEDPYIYLASDKTIIEKELLVSMADNKSFVLVYVCTADGYVQYGRSIDGSKIDKSNVSDWLCSFGISVDGMGGVSVAEETPFARLVVYSNPINVLAVNNGDDAFDMENAGDYQDADENYSEPANQTGVSPDSFTYEISDKDNYLYSKNELTKMISDKQKEIEKLGLDKKQAEINVKKAKAKLASGAEVASISGTVTFIAPDTRHLSDSGYFATITSSNGMSVSATIGEFSRDKISVGDMVTITDWNSNSVYSGEITSISETPINTEEDSNSGDLSTESLYEFTVTSDENFELGEYSGVSVTLNKEKLNNAIFLSLAYVREENGKFYVLVENGDGLLEKRVVKTQGGIIYGSFIAISGGLTTDDYIALPYGKSAEGMHTVHVTENELYGMFGMFM